MRMAKGAVCAAVLSLGVLGWGQSPASGPATRPVDPLNLERTLQTAISLDVDEKPLGTLVSELSSQTRTNIVANWNALGKAGITKTTPVTLHLKNLPYEQVVKTLMEVLPTQGGPSGRANYGVGDNTLVLTTNAYIGKGIATQLFPLQKVMAYELPGGTGADARLIANVLREVLVRAGEPMDDRNHAMAMRNGMLAATVSERGLSILARATAMLNTPVKPGQFAPGTAVTAAAKKGADAWARAGRGGQAGGPLVEIARRPEIAGVNIALLPGTSDELAKPTPSLASTMSDGGVLLVGPRDALAGRTVFAAYDLRDLIKRLATKQRPAPGAIDLQGQIVKEIEKRVPAAGGWGETLEDAGEQKASIVMGYNGLLLVFGTADQQRSVTMALQELGR